MSLKSFRFLVVSFRQFVTGKTFAVVAHVNLIKNVFPHYTILRESFLSTAAAMEIIQKPFGESDSGT